MNAFDVIIIGFGKGGKTLAAEFAKRGRKVAIVVFRPKHWFIRLKLLPV